MAPDGGPPAYDSSTAKPVGAEKSPLGPGHDMTEDEKLARKLQDEENARAGVGTATGSRGEADSYYSSGAPPQYGAQAPYGQQQSQYGSQPPYGQQSSPYNQQSPYGGPSPGPQGPQGMYNDPNGPMDQSQKKGFLGKLLGRNKQRPPYQQPYQQQGPYQQPYQGQYAAPPGAPSKKPGMGPMGAAALGAGGGLLGGVLLGEALDHHGGYGMGGMGMGPMGMGGMGMGGMGMGGGYGGDNGYGTLKVPQCPDH